MKPSFFIALWIYLIPVAVKAQTIIHMASPDKNISLQVFTSQSNQVFYSISYKKKGVVLPSSIGFVLSKPEATLSNFSITGVDSARIDETWKPVWGEVKEIRNNYNQLYIHLRDLSPQAIFLNVTFRVYNDGVGFRFEFPLQPAMHHFVVMDELTQIAMSGNHKAFWQPGDFDSNEFLYATTPLSEVDADRAHETEKGIAV
ncbi:MAG TPA: glycoside hydrolase family 97 N-terminal domain-containing protein, partial [Cyclobacteriaceae bacterium]|nr:glycoside hydrolase family 97 N-terminal domain-containing protein [Cyclobacteriaceae bacterium]